KLETGLDLTALFCYLYPLYSLVVSISDYFFKSDFLMEEVKVLSFWSSPFGMHVQIGLEEKGVKYEYREENVRIYKVVSHIIRSNGDALEQAKHDILENLEHLDGALKHMSKGGPHFGGEEFGFMDISLIPFAAWFHTNEIIGNFKLSFLLLHVWVTKCMERESVKKIVPTPERLLEFALQIRKKFVIYEAGSRITRSKGYALEEAKRDMLENMEHLEGALKQLSKGGPYFGGEEFGFMDIAYISFASWFHSHEIIGNFKLPLETRFPLFTK
ncbi:hypothetical protein KI387_034340, partial [Taxus chinensis]